MTKPINYVIALAILGVLATLSVILPIYMDDLVYRVELKNLKIGKLKDWKILKFKGWKAVRL